MGKSNQNVLQMVKFTLFSISAGIVQTVVFTALTELVPLIFNVKLGYWACYLPSLVLSVLAKDDFVSFYDRNRGQQS